MIGELVDSKLYGRDLYRIESPALVGRYNQSLDELGVRPTALQRFSIDGLGWSPEIADEFDDPYYLTAGPGNPFAIIVSPSQWRGASYFSLFSYDREILEGYLQKFEREVADLTAERCIGLDFDQGFTNFESPRDLLLIHEVTVRTLAGAISDAANSQRELIGRFMAEGNGWFDPAIRHALLESARRSGDLRQRRVEVSPYRVDAIRNFHCRHFGGVFVFSKQESTGRFLVCEDRQVFDSFRGQLGEAYHLESPQLIEVLMQTGLVTLDPERFLERPGILEIKRELFVACLLCEADHELDYFALTGAQRKSRLRRLRSSIPALLHELESFMKLAPRTRAVCTGGLSAKLVTTLLRPSTSLSRHDRTVVLRLLCRLNPYDIVQLFAVDRPHFFKLYGSWPKSKRHMVMHLCDDQEYLKHFFDQ